MTHESKAAAKPESQEQIGSERHEEEAAPTSSASPPSPQSKEALEAALAEANERAEENRNQYLRTAADLENVRRRATRDVQQAHKFGLEKFARELLAVKDSLELGLEASSSADVESLREGKLATLKLLGSAFEKFGLTELDPEGEPFDPEFHEAMAMRESSVAEPGSVLEVVQKGYLLNGRLLRPARVIVAREAEG